MWDAIRHRLAFWGLFLTIVGTLWVMAWNQYLEGQIRYGNPPTYRMILN